MKIKKEPNGNVSILETGRLGECWRINFDRWHSSEEYRRKWALTHFGNFDHDKRSSVPIIGQSMFDGRIYDGRAEVMQVQDRAGQMESHPAMKPILADSELSDLWKRIQAED